MLCEYDYMCLGIKGDDGDGPALRFDDTLKVGRSYKSETFANQILTSKEGPLASDFEILEFEFYII